MHKSEEYVTMATCCGGGGVGGRSIAGGGDFALGANRLRSSCRCVSERGKDINVASVYSQWAKHTSLNADSSVGPPSCSESLTSSVCFSDNGCSCVRTARSGGSLSLACE